MASLVCPYLQQTGPSWATFSEFGPSLHVFAHDATNICPRFSCGYEYELEIRLPPINAVHDKPAHHDVS